MRVDKETRRADPHGDLRQGDILRIEDQASLGRSERLGVVINADCDLANRKTDGVVAYLPLYTFRDFMESFWLHDYFNVVCKSATDKILQSTKLTSEYGEQLCSWLAADSATEVGTKIKTKFAIKRNLEKEFDGNIMRISICLDPTKAPFEIFKEICRLENDPEKAARTQIRAAKKNLGDGHFFFSDLVGHDAVGFIIRMRRIYTIDADCCFISNAAKMAASSGTRPTALRFATFNPIYQFKIAQLFGLQFSRIGLPDEVADLSELAIDDLVSQVIQVS
jgi:hypothetical protein